jgi:hypothetical protein
MPIDAERASDEARGLDFALMTLAVVDGERVEREAFGFRNRGSRVGIEAAAEKYYRSQLVSW